MATWQRRALRDLLPKLVLGGAAVLGLLIGLASLRSDPSPEAVEAAARTTLPPGPTTTAPLVVSPVSTVPRTVPPGAEVDGDELMGQSVDGDAVDGLASSSTLVIEVTEFRGGEELVVIRGGELRPSLAALAEAQLSGSLGNLRYVEEVALGFLARLDDPSRAYTEDERAFLIVFVETVGRRLDQRDPTRIDE